MAVFFFTTEKDNQHALDIPIVHKNKMVSIIIVSIIYMNKNDGSKVFYMLSLSNKD